MARLLGVLDVLKVGSFSGLWVGALLGAVAWPTPLRKVVWVLLGLLVAAVAVVAYTPVMRMPAARLVRMDESACVDAVVPLASGVNDDGLMSGDGLDRLLSAFAVARDTAIHCTHRPPLLLTIVRQQRPPYRTSEQDQRFIAGLANDGVPVLWTGIIASTRDEALAVAAMARRSGWARVAVVTSPLHTRRACAAFEQTGMAVRCVAASGRQAAFHAMRGPEDRLRVFRWWLYETSATIVYGSRGWM